MIRHITRRHLIKGVLALGMGFIMVPEVAAVLPTIVLNRTFVGQVQIIQNSVANLTDVDVFTVPTGVSFMLTDIIISNDNANSSCCARIFRGPGAATARTGFITVPAGGSIHIQFASGINFGSGQVVNVRNGASAGPLHFTLRGYRFTVP